MVLTTSPLGEVVVTDDGSLTLSHPEHGECYHSRAGALAEARSLYVDASGVVDRWRGREAVAVLDVGLGLGYNAVATLASWAAAPAPPPLALTSLEVDPALVAALASGQAPWQKGWEPSLRTMAAALRPTGSVTWEARLPHPAAKASGAHWRVFVADASRAEVPRAPGAGYDFVWQDPFSPAKNPPLWSAAWFAAVGAAAAPGCRLMTYSVARAVRDGLTAAGWSCEKVPTPETVSKRHWLKATWRQEA